MMLDLHLYISEILRAFRSSCIPTNRKNKSLLRGSDIVFTRHLSIGSTQQESIGPPVKGHLVDASLAGRWCVEMVCRGYVLTGHILRDM